MQTPESSLEVLAKRVAKLEAQNRRLKKAGIASFILAAAVMAMGQASPSKVIEAQKIILRGSGGEERGELFAGEAAWGLVLFNKNSTKAASLVVSSYGNGILLFDQNGNGRQTFMANLDESNWAVFRPGSDSAQVEMFDRAQGAGFAIRDRANNPRVELGWSANGSVVNLSDSNGMVRAAVTGGDLGFVSYSKDGSLDWSPGWDKLSPEEQKQLRGLLPKLPK
jgi:hypothetical protein